MSTKGDDVDVNDARNEASWDWEDWDEVEDDESDPIMFQPHHCDPSE